MTHLGRRTFLAFGAAVATSSAMRASRVHAEPSAEIRILVFPDGHVEADGRTLDDAGLEAVARAHVQAVGADRARAVIAADRSVAYARVIAIMDALRRGGLTQIALAVQPGG